MKKIVFLLIVVLIFALTSCDMISDIRDAASDPYMSSSGIPDWAQGIKELSGGTNNPFMYYAEYKLVEGTKDNLYFVTMENKVYSLDSLAEYYATSNSKVKNIYYKKDYSWTRSTNNSYSVETRVYVFSVYASYYNRDNDVRLVELTYTVTNSDYSGTSTRFEVSYHPYI